MAVAKNQTIGAAFVDLESGKKHIFANETNGVSLNTYGDWDIEPSSQIYVKTGCRCVSKAIHL